MIHGRTILAIVLVALGLVWIGQGTGLVMWPRASFMLQQTQWAYYGAALVIVGLLMLVYSARNRG